MKTVPEYGQVLANAGFVDVQAKNYTKEFVDVLKRELGEFTAKKEAIIEEFSQKDFDYIVNGWNDKVGRCADGDQVWGYFVAKKPYAWINNKNPVYLKNYFSLLFIFYTSFFKNVSIS